MKLKQIKEKINKFEDYLNISKRYPLYFNKVVFRWCWFIIFVVMFSILATNQYKFKMMWIENPLNTTLLNQLRTCDNEVVLGIVPQEFNCVENPTKELINLCGGDCPTYLQPYQVIGDKPTIQYRYSQLILFILILVMFLINHLVWYKNKGDLKKWKI